MALVLDGDSGIVGVLATNADGDVIIDTNTFFVDAPNNRVGIGTLTPQDKLHIVDGDLGIENTSGRRYRIIAEASGDLTIRDQTAAQGRLTINTSGNVGIGTDSPSQVLHVKGTNSPIRIDNAGSGRSGIEIYNGTTKKADITWSEGNANLEIKNYRNDSQSDGPYANIDFFTGGSLATSPDYSPSLRMRIQQTGEVGIGTSNPTELLHLDSSNNTRLRISTTNAGAVPEIQLYNAVKEWKIGVETSTDSGGGAYSGAGPNYFHIRNATDNNPGLSLFTDGSAYFHKGTLLWNNRQDIGRVDQGNTGSFYTSYGIQKFQFEIPSDNNWYDVLTNFRESTGYFWATVSDTSSRRKKVYEFNRTSPAYGVSTFSLVHDHGGGWNTGDFNFQVVSDGSSSFRLQCQRSSYYSSSNISNGRITILVF
jgi:hypothetical protein